jgi:hypothetical protein
VPARRPRSERASELVVDPRDPGLSGARLELVEPEPVAVDGLTGLPSVSRFGLLGFRRLLHR